MAKGGFQLNKDLVDLQLLSLPLNEEQKRLCEQFGFSNSFIGEIENSIQDQRESLSSVQEVPKSYKTTSEMEPLAISNKVNSQDERKIVKKPFLKKGEGLTTRFKVNPDKFKLENLPKYKYARRGSKDKENHPIAPEEEESKDDDVIEGSQDVKEPTNWRNRLAVRKSCLKNSPNSNSMAAILEKVTINMQQLNVNNDITEDSKGNNEPKSTKRMLEFSKKSPKVTFNTEVKQIPYENYFNRSEEEEHQEPVEEENEEDHSEESENEEEEAGSENEEEEVGSENEEQSNSEEEDSEEENEEETALIDQEKEEIIEDPKLLVPSRAIEMHSQLMEFNAVSSTPMESFKNVIMCSNNETMSPRSELIEKGCILKTKLKDLEQEIEHFRNQNRNLIKMKQSYELEKLELENKKQELEDQISDQKIKMEIYFHDERLKIEAEKEKYLKLQKKIKNPNKKDQEEMKKLQEKVDELEKDIKNREIKHGASQTRLRSQIRSLEKEIKEQNLTIDSLKKENKKLELDNIRLRRQSNMKMLENINKNILKLAPPTVDRSIEKLPPVVEKEKDKIIPHPKIIQEKSKPTSTGAKPKSKAVPEENDSSSCQSSDYESTGNIEEKSSYFPEPNIHSNSDSSILETINRNVARLSAPEINPITESFPPPIKSEKSEVNMNFHENKSSSLNSFKKKIKSTTPEILPNQRPKPKTPPSPDFHNQEETDSSCEPPTAEQYSSKNYHYLRSRGTKKSQENSNPDKNTNTSNAQKREIINLDGSKDIWFPDGTLKKQSPDGMFIKFYYPNKDVKECNVNEGTVKYYYAESNTWHTSYIDGLEIYEFPNGQTEHRHKNGKIEIFFPNGATRISNSKDRRVAEEWKYPDGTTVVQQRNGDKIISMPNGNREIHTEAFKKLECPDGTVKLIYPDGRQETRYSNGRTRIKDKSGKLIMDTDGPY